MKRTLANKAMRLAIMVITLSIFNLLLFSIIPWISVEENDFVKETLHFNKLMMERSSNIEINNLAVDLNFISIFYFLIIAISFIFLIGMLLHASLKKPLIARSLLTIGLINVAFCLIVIAFQILFIIKVNSIELISFSSIISIFNYAYIPFIFSIILFIYSLFQTKVVIPPLVELYFSNEPKIKDANKIKKTKKEIPAVQPQLKNEKEVTTKPSTLPITGKKRAELENWLGGEIQNIEKSVEIKDSKEISVQANKDLIEEKSMNDENKLIKNEENNLDFIEEKKPTEEIKEEKMVEPESISNSTIEQPLEKKPEKELKNNIQSPFKFEKKIEKPQDSEEVQPSEKFEKALLSAIEKKHIERKTSRLEDKENKLEIEAKQDKSLESNGEENKESLTRIPLPDDKLEEDEKNLSDEKINPQNIRDNVEQVKDQIEDKPIQPDEDELPDITIKQVQHSDDIMIPIDNKTEENIVKKISVKCPQCNHTFSFEKGPGETKIKCPNCGKEGVVR